MGQTEIPPSSEPFQIKGESDTREIRTVSSADLMQGAAEIQITHRDDVYRLRVTRSGKLILHK